MWGGGAYGHNILFAWFTLISCSIIISAFPTQRILRPPAKRIRQCPRLYGIKGFQAWFNTQFPDATIELDPHSRENFDHVLVDMNQVLHVILRRSRSRDHAIRMLMRELDRMIQITTPTKSFVLALDGPPAAAKLATQRKRRYGTLVRTQWKLKHFEKLRITKKAREKRLRGYKSNLRSLELTPGTHLMESMEATLVYWAWQRLQLQHSKLRNVKIYVNPSSVPGEGEVKLLEWIFEHGPFTFASASKKKQQSICFLGGDSDLVLEGFVVPPSFAHNVFVVRQENAKKTTCISLWEATRTLAKSLNTEDRQQIIQIRTDLVLLMIMNGNDYLPKLRGSRGFSNIVSIYKQTLQQHKSGLVHPDTLDFHLDFCIAFFEQMFLSSPLDLSGDQQDPDGNEDDEQQRRTPLGELNQLVDGNFLPSPLKFHVFQDAADIDDIGEEDREVDEDDLDSSGDDEGEEDDIVEAFDNKRDDEEDDDDDDDEVLDQVLVRMSLGNPDSDDYLMYELWQDRDEPFKHARQKLAAMALDEFLGTDYAGGTDDFDFEAGITKGGYSWEISQSIEGKVDQYLGGLLWNLQTYQDGICADYGYNYGRRMAPTAEEIVDFFQEAKEQKRPVGKQALLGDNDESFGKPISAGLSCLAALPSEVNFLVPEPYRWLPAATVEELYRRCVDPIDNVFDMQSFEHLCHEEVGKIKLLRNETNDERVESSDGRHTVTGDHYWMVLGKSNIPLKHPYDPPPPPMKEFQELDKNNLIRVHRKLAIAKPRQRAVWGHKSPPTQTNRQTRRQRNEIVHTDAGQRFWERKSILDIGYKIAFPKEHARHMAERRREEEQNQLFETTEGYDPKQKIELPSGVVQQKAGIISRMKSFNITTPPETVATNIDGQTSLDVLKALEDVGIVGTFQFDMKSPSPSKFAECNPSAYEEVVLTIPKGNSRNNVLNHTVVVSQDRHINTQTRKALKHYLTSLALDEICLPAVDWRTSSYSELKKNLIRAGGEREIRTISLTSRLEEYNLLLPPDDPIENKNGLTALACLNLLRDAGLIGKTRFAMKSPSKSKYAALSPLNYENIQLKIKRGKDKNISILRKDLNYSQDRDVNKQTRKALRHHLASLALGDMTGPEKQWSEMTSSELLAFLKENARAAKTLPRQNPK